MAMEFYKVSQSLFLWIISEHTREYVNPKKLEGSRLGTAAKELNLRWVSKHQPNCVLLSSQKKKNENKNKTRTSMTMAGVQCLV